MSLRENERETNWRFLFQGFFYREVDKLSNGKDKKQRDIFVRMVK